MWSDCASLWSHCSPITARCGYELGAGSIDTAPSLGVPEVSTAAELGRAAERASVFAVIRSQRRAPADA